VSVHFRPAAILAIEPSTSSFGFIVKVAGGYLADEGIRAAIAAARPLLAPFVATGEEPRC
jgi:hypothetical protein